jgi:hypothetical protein
MSESVSGRATLILLVSLVLAACVGMNEGPVRVNQSLDTRFSEIQRINDQECLKGVAPGGGAEAQRAHRNHVVSAYVAAADEAYFGYERDLLAFVRSNELGASVATQLLAAIGGVSGNANITRAAGVTAGVIGGTRDALIKSLLNQTVTALLAHMRGGRESQYAIIVERRALPYADFNTCDALRDAQTYEQAGTLIAALAAMDASAADEETAGRAESAQAIERITFARDPLSLALRVYLRRGEDQRNKARAALTALMDAGTIPRRPVGQYLGEFQAGRGTPAERLALGREIVRTEGRTEAGNALAATIPD